MSSDHLGRDGQQPDRPQIRDPREEDYNEYRRLQEIWDERGHLFDTRRELTMAKGMGNISSKQANKIYHETVKSYIVVLHTLFTDVYPEDGREYWANTNLGTQTIQPPDEVKDDLLDRKNERFVEPASERKRQFAGLKSILETPGLQEFEFTATIEGHKKPDRQKTATKEVSVPWHILETAVLTANKFTSDIGIDAKLGGQQDSETEPL